MYLQSRFAIGGGVVNFIIRHFCMSRHNCRRRRRSTNKASELWGRLRLIISQFAPLKGNNGTIINCLPKPHVFAISNQVRTADEALCCSIHFIIIHHIVVIIWHTSSSLSWAFSLFPSLSRFSYEWYHQHSFSRDLHCT